MKINLSQLKLRQWVFLGTFALLLVMGLSQFLPATSQTMQNSLGTPVNLSQLKVATPSACTGLPPTPEFLSQFAQIQKLYKTDFTQFQQLLTEVVSTNNNIGGSIVHFPNGDKQVFRGSILAKNLPCLEQLTKEKGVKTIVNLFTGALIPEWELSTEEEKAFDHMGGESYIHILRFSDQPKPEDNYTMADVKARLTQIVWLIAAAPGNVMIHCVGGIHRTGEVYGVLQKCVNKVSIDQVIDNYIKHAGGTMENNLEYREVDIEVLRSFDCTTLDFKAKT